MTMNERRIALRVMETWGRNSACQGSRTGIREIRLRPEGLVRAQVARTEERSRGVAP